MNRLVVLSIFGLVLFLSLSPPARAYPTFIRHEYTSCTACHMEPRGGGLLTDYGNGIAGSMSLFPMDYQGPPQTPFYRAFTLNNTLTHGLQFRMMSVMKEGHSASTFPMQLDYLNSTKVNEKSRIDATVGIAVRRNRAGGVDINATLWDRIALRKLLWATRYREDGEISVGRDLLPIGLFIDDHTTSVRAENRRSVLDYPTQIRWEKWNEKISHTVYAFAPSFEETFLNREYGAGYRPEYYFNSRMAVGANALVGRSLAIQRELAGIFSRLSPMDRVAILFEYDWTLRSTLNSAQNTTFQQHTFYLNPSYELREGLEAGFVAEYYKCEAPFTDEKYRIGPSIFTRISRQFTLITDLRDSTGDGIRELYAAVQMFAHL